MKTNLTFGIVLITLLWSVSSCGKKASSSSLPELSDSLAEQLFCGQPVYSFEEQAIMADSTLFTSNLKSLLSEAVQLNTNTSYVCLHRYLHRNTIFDEGKFYDISKQFNGDSAIVSYKILKMLDGREHVENFQLKLFNDHGKWLIDDMGSGYKDWRMNRLKTVMGCCRIMLADYNFRLMTRVYAAETKNEQLLNALGIEYSQFDQYLKTYPDSVTQAARISANLEYNVPDEAIEELESRGFGVQVIIAQTNEMTKYLHNHDKPFTFPEVDPAHTLSNRFRKTLEHYWDLPNDPFMNYGPRNFNPTLHSYRIIVSGEITALNADTVDCELNVLEAANIELSLINHMYQRYIFEDGEWHIDDYDHHLDNLCREIYNTRNLFQSHHWKQQCDNALNGKTKITPEEIKRLRIEVQEYFEKYKEEN